MKSRYVPWTQEQVDAHLARFRSLAVPVADMEPNPQVAPKKKNVRQDVHSRVNIKVHSKRWRVVDPDGLAVKSAIDGLVRGGILADDSAEYVEAVTFTQEKISKEQPEETIIEIWQEGAL